MPVFFEMDTGKSWMPFDHQLHDKLLRGKGNVTASPKHVRCLSNDLGSEIHGSDSPSFILSHRHSGQLPMGQALYQPTPPLQGPLSYGRLHDPAELLPVVRVVCTPGREVITLKKDD